MMQKQQGFVSAGGGIRLAATLHKSGIREVGDFVIILAHGFTGDQMEKGRFPALARILVDRSPQVDVLTFDFRGSGGSTDAELTVAGFTQDLNAVLTYCHGMGYRRIGVVGFSLGALTALHVVQEHIHALALWSPVTAAVQDPRKRYTAAQLAELDQVGSIVYPVHHWNRRDHVVIPQQMLDERARVDQGALCRRVRYPVLIVHGGEDARVPFEDSVCAMRHLPEGSELFRVPGAGHSFEGRHLQIAIGALSTFFRDTWGY